MFNKLKNFFGYFEEIFKFGYLYNLHKKDIKSQRPYLLRIILVILNSFVLCLFVFRVLYPEKLFLFLGGKYILSFYFLGAIFFIFIHLVVLYIDKENSIGYRVFNDTKKIAINSYFYIFIFISVVQFVIAVFLLVDSLVYSYSVATLLSESGEILKFNYSPICALYDYYSGKLTHTEFLFLLTHCTLGAEYKRELYYDSVENSNTTLSFTEFFKKKNL